MPASLSVIIATFNVEDRLRDCLESVKWADDIFVVDSYSTDGTLALAREYTDHIAQHEYVSAGAQRNWAIPQVHSDWILVLDSDEIITPELAARIQGVLADGTDCDGFNIKRMTIFFGKLIRHCGWHREHVVRMWRNGKGRYQDRAVHAAAIVDGKMGVFEDYILHNTYRSFDDYLEIFGRYTTWGAAELRKHGKRPSWVNLTLRPLWRFFLMYVIRHGFLDGKHGLVLCTLAAYSVFMKYAKLWDVHRREALEPPQPQELDKARDAVQSLTES